MSCKIVKEDGNFLNVPEKFVFEMIFALFKSLTDDPINKEMSASEICTRLCLLKDLQDLTDFFGQEKIIKAFGEI